MKRWIEMMIGLIGLVTVASGTYLDQFPEKARALEGTDLLMVSQVGEVPDLRKVTVAGVLDALEEIGIDAASLEGQIGEDQLPDLIEAVLIPRVGTEAEVDATTLALGELAFVSDLETFRIGDGTTPGGIDYANTYSGLIDQDLSTESAPWFGSLLIGDKDDGSSLNDWLIASGNTHGFPFVGPEDIAFIYMGDIPALSMWFQGGATWADRLIEIRDPVEIDTWIDLPERATAPSAPSANTARIFAKDNGSGKTQLCVLFNTGAVQVIATEP
ncbi:MAG: hypothetical protein ACQKBU_12550 [Verrucomicrobiales bacterium]